MLSPVCTEQIKARFRKFGSHRKKITSQCSVDPRDLTDRKLQMHVTGDNSIYLSK